MPERSLGPPPPEKALESLWVTDIYSYQGNVDRIAGLKKIHEAIGHNSIVETMSPLILLEGAYREYQQNGLSPKLRKALSEVWDNLSPDGQLPLIVRRLFPNREGISADGPRTGPVNTFEELTSEVEKFYRYYDEHGYQREGIKPEIYIHRIANVAAPPQKEVPFLPYPGGDATPLSAAKVQIRATFGADESVQGFPSDIWEVNFEPDGSIRIVQKTHAQKTESVIPGKETYPRITIPKEFQNNDTLNYLQVLAIATVCHNMQEKFGPHRLEFNQVKIDEREPIVVIEASPFSIEEIPSEKLAEFITPKTQVVTIFRQEEDFAKIPPNQTVFVHLPQTHFQGNERREALTQLAIKAAQLNTKLVTFVAGNIATQHAINALREHNHLCLFVGDECFEDNEALTVFISDGKLSWERKNPIVSSEKMPGRELERIGGKANGLRKLKENGFLVPPYFVIESSLLRRVINELTLHNKIQELEETTEETLKKATAEVKKAILQFDLSKLNSFTQDLEAMLQKIDGGKFSVRSSASCEDSEYSFGGVFHTELNSTKETILRAILNVLASTYNPQSVDWAKLIGIRPAEIKMAVIIQKMVDAQKTGGTLHTKDVKYHDTDDTENLRIEATEGLGIQIADGVTKAPQEIIVDRKTAVQKTRGHPVLSQDEISKLVEIGLAVEKKLKEGYQEIEWAITNDGQIYLLQARKLIVPH